MRAQRYNLELPVHYRRIGQKSWQEGITANVSSSGVLFHAADSLDVDMNIEMRLPLPIGATPESFPEVFCSGRIVRTVPSAAAETRGFAATITEYQIRRVTEH